MIHETAVIDKPCQIGERTAIWHFCHVSEKASIGEDCVLGQNVYVGPGVRIGDRVKIQNNVSVYVGVTLEDDVFVGPSAVFTNVKKPKARARGEFARTLVKHGAVIGANVTIICGVQIGANSFVGAGSVVTHDVPDGAMVYGNPARRRA